MSGHTPGPWVADNFLCDGDHALRVAMPDRHGQPTATIAFCEHNWNDGGQYDRRISWAEAEANARLCSAAPDLLEAVQDLLAPLERAAAALVSNGFVMDEFAQASFERAKAAIAKATS